MIKETFIRTINGQSIQIDHLGFKPLSEQKESALKALDEEVTERLKESDKFGFIPYNNFECTIEWKLIQTT